MVIIRAPMELTIPNPNPMLTNCLFRKSFRLNNIGWLNPLPLVPVHSENSRTLNPSKVLGSKRVEGCMRRRLVVKVSIDRGVSRPDESDPTFSDPDASMAQLLNGAEVVANKDYGSALAGNPFHSSQALLLELDVTDGQHLVDDEDLRFQMGGHGKGEPDRTCPTNSV